MWHISLDPSEEPVISGECLTLHAHTTGTTAICPCCGKRTSAIHSYRYRKIQCTEWLGHHTILILKTRHMVCTNKECGKKIFAEPLAMTHPYGRHTYDVEERIRHEALEQTARFTEKLTERQIPYVLLDSYMPDLKPLAFFGQDSFASGYFAARMLMLIANKEKEIALMKQTRNGLVGSKQQANRETGFRHYMVDHYPEIKITEVDLPLDEEKKDYDGILEKFFKEHPQVHHCITFNSKAHLVGEFLQKTNRRNIQIMGYDMVPKNVKCIHNGSISFLIAQHAYQQGYASVDALFNAIVMKRQVNPVNYMPIEILTKENVDFYRRTAI